MISEIFLLMPGLHQHQQTYKFLCFWQKDRKIRNFPSGFQETDRFFYISIIDSWIAGYPGWLGLEMRPHTINLIKE
jgi:hypothetical protein